MSNVFGFSKEAAFLQLKNTSSVGYVTIDTNQTITGLKTFDNNLICNYNIYTKNLNADFGVQADSVTATSFYPTAIYFPDGSVQTTANSAATTAIIVTSDNAAQNCYLTYVKTGFTGSKSIYMDDVSPGALLYNPSLGQLSASTYTIGDSATTSSSLLSQVNSGSDLQICNKYPFGDMRFSCYDTLGNIVSPLVCNAVFTSVTKPLYFTGTDVNDRKISNVYYELVNQTTLAVMGTIYSNSVNFIYDNNVNSGVHRFAANNASGVQSLPLEFSYDNFAITTTNPPTSSAGIPPNDNSSKLATTAWVQSNYSNYVTLNTAQTITGQKTFSDHLYTQSIYGQNSYGLSLFSTTTNSKITLSPGNVFCFEAVYYGCSTFTPLNVRDPLNLYSIGMKANSSAAYLNPVVGSGDHVIAAQNQSGGGGINSGVLTVTSYSSTNTGLRITPDTVTLGSGGTLLTPTSYLEVNNGTTAVSVGPIPATGDNSNKIATTAWVQSVLNGGTAPASTIQMTENLTNAYFPLCYSTGSPNGFKSIYQTYLVAANSGLRYNPSNWDLCLTSINSIPIRLQNTSSIKIGAPSPTTFSISTTQSTCIGSFAGEGTGIGNTAIGFQSAYSLYTGEDNVVIGRSAGYNLQIGNRNLFIGREAGGNVGSGNDNIILGHQKLGTTSLTNNILIGADSSVNNSIKIGDGTQTQYQQGQYNHTVARYVTTTNVYMGWTLPAILPSIVILATYYAAQGQTIYLPTQYLSDPNRYTGTIIRFRKSIPTYPVPGAFGDTWQVYIDAGATRIIPFDDILPLTNIYSFNDTQFYCEMLFDGYYWCMTVVH